MSKRSVPTKSLSAVCTPNERPLLRPPIEPMEARAESEIPRGDQWQYEPKWDGFRALVLRDGMNISVYSKSGQPLDRYFPEIIDAVRRIPAQRFVLDGEIVIERDGRLDFDALLQRIHPAASRIARLARETPARYLVFDLLAAEQDDALHRRPLAERRSALERFAARFADPIALSPASRDRERALDWFEHGAPWFDGVIAKRIDAPYEFGGRHQMVKVKPLTTVDCVVGGFRRAKDGHAIASLLLGLYNDAGLLDLVGFCSGLDARERARAAELLAPHEGGTGFTGTKPGGASRWGSRDTAWTPLEPRVVVEVLVDHVTGHRFRHGARFVRWRSDKDPRACTTDQIF